MGLLRVHPISGGLRLAGGDEDGAWVTLQELKPRGDIGGMFATGVIGDAKIGHHEAARQFDDDKSEPLQNVYYGFSRILAVVTGINFTDDARISPLLI